MNHVEQEITDLIREYSKAVSTADRHSIPSFYLPDALFMPHGIVTLSKEEITKKASGKYLEATKFELQYQVTDINHQQDFAFVNAEATATSTDPATGKRSIVKTRDFFALKCVGGEWKIFRYIFNSLPG